MLCLSGFELYSRWVAPGSSSISHQGQFQIELLPTLCQRSFTATLANPQLNTTDMTDPHDCTGAIIRFTANVVNDREVFREEFPEDIVVRMPRYFSTSAQKCYTCNLFLFFYIFQLNANL